MQGMIKDLCGKQIRVASNPEFLRQGSSVQDTLNPSRIVIGTRDQTAMARLFELYSSFVDNPNDKILFVDPVSAEMIKNAANSFLAIKISYANQIANICEKVGADVEQVMKGVGMDPRIGTQFLKAGIGWGGSCFPKDVQSLMHTARQVGVDPILIQAADEVNNLQASRFGV
jgi:UDPglucose 6-dehydrogenase